MKKLKMRMERGETEVALEGDSVVTLHGTNPAVFLQIDEGSFDVVYCHLTAKRVKRLRDWLTRWLDEQKERK